MGSLRVFLLLIRLTKKMQSLPLDEFFPSSWEHEHRNNHGAGSALTIVDTCRVDRCEQQRTRLRGLLPTPRNRYKPSRYTGHSFPETPLSTRSPQTTPSPARCPLPSKTLFYVRTPDFCLMRVQHGTSLHMLTLAACSIELLC